MSKVIIPGQPQESTVFCSLCGIGDMDEKCLTMVRAAKGAICRNCIITARNVLDEQMLNAVAALHTKLEDIERRGTRMVRPS